MNDRTVTSLQIQIAVEGAALSLFVQALCRALETKLAARVSIMRVAGDDRSRQPALESLLALEKMVLRRHRPCWSDRMAPEAFAEWPPSQDGDEPDLVIDLTAAGLPPGGVPLLRPLFDGQRGEFGLVSALFFRGTPQIDIESIAASSPDPVVLAAGVASLEAAAGLGGAMEAVWSRVLLLLLKAIATPPGAPGSAPPIPVPARAIGRSDGLVRSGRMLAAAAARAAYRLCCHAPHWRIGWRRVGPADDVWARRDLGGVAWNVLPDPTDHFYADPVPFRWQNRDYLFFEDLDHKTRKGIICVVAFDSDGRPGPAIPVLEEPWHLSYPFLIAAEGEVWMVPEASLSGEISIYRATRFPVAWERHATLVSGVEAADATIVAHQGRFWMFAVTRQGVGGYSDTLSLWSSPTVFGPWQPHAANPVLVDDRSARPAGNMIRRNGELMRPVQDCRNGYGAALSLARVTRLDDQGFEQVVETHLSPAREWPGRKLHTLNGNGHLEVIDGSILRPKPALAARLVDHLYRPPD